MNKKICITTDWHLDCKNGSEILLESQLRFFKNTFIKTLKKNNIDTIIHLGDFTDNPQKIGIRTKNTIIDLFENEFKDFKWYIIEGNHDLPIRSDLKISSVRFLKKFPNVTIIDDITKLEFFGKETLLVPWQVDNEEFAMKVNNKNTTCEICMGHFPINGFYMNAKMACTDELNPDIFFSNFKVTLSGHFHNRDIKKRGNSTIHYIGNPFHFNRNDSNSERGFIIFDFETLEHEYINNNDSIKYLKVKYPEDYSKIPIEGNIIDVDYFYDEHSVEEDFQDYLKGIQERNPLYPPYPKRINNIEESKKDIQIESKSNRSILTEFVSKTIIDTEQKEILDRLDDLYNECIKGAIDD